MIIAQKTHVSMSSRSGRTCPRPIRDQWRLEPEYRVISGNLAQAGASCMPYEAAATRTASSPAMIPQDASMFLFPRPLRHLYLTRQTEYAAISNFSTAQGHEQRNNVFRAGAA